METTDFEEIIGNRPPGDASPAKPIIQAPADITTEIASLVTSTRALAIKTDDDLAVAESALTRAKKVIAAIGNLYKDEKATRYQAHKAIVAEESFMLAAPNKVVEVCTAAIKPYLRAKEIERERERRRLEEAARAEAEERRRQEAEQARKEAEERAKREREEAEERARKEREAAQRTAAAIEEEGVSRAAELERTGNVDEAKRVLADAERRRDNILEDVDEVTAKIHEDAESVATRVEAEGRAVAQEIETTPVQSVHVAAPPPVSSRLKSSSTSKTYKCNREKAIAPQNKLKAMKFAVAEAERGNWTPMAWFDHNFGRIDSSARDQKEMFPSEELCGIDVGLDIGLRSKPTPRAEQET